MITLSLDKVTKTLNKKDPVDLIKNGCGHDEYDNIAAMITSRVNVEGAGTNSDLAIKMFCVFFEQFCTGFDVSNKPVGPFTHDHIPTMEYFYKLADELTA